MLEQQIYSIESANINQETLVAMKNAGAAMKQIHGNMKMEDVDNTMYGPPNPIPKNLNFPAPRHHHFSALMTRALVHLRPKLPAFRYYHFSISMLI